MVSIELLPSNRHLYLYAAASGNFAWLMNYPCFPDFSVSSAAGCRRSVKRCQMFASSFILYLFRNWFPFMSVFLKREWQICCRAVAGQNQKCKVYPPVKWKMGRLCSSLVAEQQVTRAPLCTYHGASYLLRHTIWSSLAVDTPALSLPLVRFLLPVVSSEE